ncbi:MAG: ATP-binding protein [Kiritimatiellae bacterium]|nr:ATP-binding protein [Kiritimatiellia bacterium]
MGIKRKLKDAEGSYFLFGPRGTGKTTWLDENLSDAIRISLLDAATKRELRSYPERLENYIGGAKDKTVVIDEVQRAPELLSVVHRLMDEKRGLRFVMTGSSARKLKRNASADLLAGRAIKRMCHPFLASEMGEAFRLEEALRLGMIPLVRYPESGTSEDVLKTYLDLYLEEEITTEGVIRNLDSFSRFLQVASFSHGSVLSASSIARESGIKRSTIDSYFDVLEEMLVASRLPVFNKRAKRQLIGHDKFYFFDTGVFRSLRPKGPLDNPNEIDGVSLEGLVYQQLKAWNDYLVEPNSLYFWRTKNGVEVDFVVYGENTFFALEVKNSCYAERKDAQSLESFVSDYPEAQALLLYRGGQVQQVSPHVKVMPVEEFLLGLDPSKPLHF